MKKILSLLLLATALFGQPRQTINNADFKGVSHILTGQSLIADAGSILTGFPGTGTVTSVDGSGGSTGLVFSGGPIVGSGTLALGGILAKAAGGTGTATPSLVQGTGISITGSWPNQTISSTLAGGTVTAVTVSTANGVSASVANQGTTPALTFTLGAITPTSVNGQTITTGSGTLTLGSNTLTASGNATISGTHTGASSGTNTGDQTITLTGDATGSGTASFAVNVGRINGTALGGLATGLLKNTTSTGVPSIANAGTDYVIPSGNVATATALQNSRTINGVSFNGTANINVSAAANTLTGTTLASNITASSLLSAAGGNFGTAAFTPASNYEVPLSFTSPLNRASNTISVNNAAADGSTRGVSTFLASDFNSSSGLISIDYTNAQASNAITKGFLTAADWVAFNSKASTSGPLSQFSATSSAELYGVISDPVGTGNLVFNTDAPLVGGSHIFVTDFGLKSASSFQLKLVAGESLDAEHVLFLSVHDGERTLEMAGNIFAPSDAVISGTNTGDQTITLTGPVTGSGTSSFATSITAGSVGPTELANTAVTPGTYTIATVTVDQQGRITSATNGTAGTVTATAGSLTSNAVVLGAGTTDTKVAAGIVTDGTSKLTLGVAGTSVGSVDFKNATSGTATLAPPTGALGTYQVTLPTAASKLPIFGQQITFTGPTAARSIALPDAAFTVARSDAAQTFTGVQTFAAPILGTPTSVTLTNGTGLPISSGVSGLGTGVATFLATPSSANLAAAITDETGSGAAVFGTSPTFTTQATIPKIVYTGAVIEVAGTGSPEGVTTAAVGSTFHRTDGGSGTTIYNKESGSGNTGWVAVTAGGSGTVTSGTAGQIAIYNATGTTVIGTNAMPTGITYTPLTIGASSLYFYGGTGNPESTTTAPKGSMWMRSDGGHDTLLYTKESGSGNTGWMPMATSKGATDASDAASGFIGEVITSQGTGSALTSTVASDVINITLTAGDWDVTGTAGYTSGAGTVIALMSQGACTTSATFTSGFYSTIFLGASASTDARNVIPTVRVNVSGSTTVYLVVQATFTISTLTPFGTLYARRVR